MEDTMIPSGNVLITTFVSPNLFWVIHNNPIRFNTIQKLNNMMQEFCTQKLQSAVKFEIGEVIAIRIKDKLCRGVIEDKIYQSHSCNFMCWLIDYGVMFKADNVFKLSTTIKSIPPLASQMSLKNIIYLKENLNFDTSGQAVMNNVQVVTPTQKSRNTSIKLLFNCKKLQFKLYKEEHNIYFGDILYNDGETDNFNSFKQYLIDKSILIDQEQEFSDIEQYIDLCKKNHLMLLENICYNIGDLLEDMDISSTCEELKMKYSQEFHYRDLTDDEKLIPLARNKRQKSNKDIDTSFEGTSTSETDISSKEISPTKISKRNNFLKFVKRQRDAQRLEHCLQSESLKHDNSPNSPKKLHKKNLFTCLDVTENNQLIKSVEKIEDQCFESNVSHNESVSDNFKLSKTRKNSYAIHKTKNKVKFVPAGACHSLNDIENYQPKNMSLNSNYSSNSDSYVKEEISSDELVSENETNGIDAIPEDDLSNACKNTMLLSDDLTNKLKVKPYCNCNQCEHWTNESGWYSKHNFNENTEVKIKISSNEIPLSLFKDENSCTDVNIISLDYGSMTKLQKQTTPKLLVHCECLPSRINDIVSVNFHPEIQTNLKQLGYKKPKKIQSYAWPALFRNQHVFIIHGSQTGKSMGYLPVLCTFLLEKNERYDFGTKNSGAPIIVILCSNTKTCEQIYDLMKILLGRNKTRVSLITYPIAHINTSHIDVLVTTPLLLVDLMKSKAINLKRLCHFVIDDGDEIFSRFHSIIEMLLEVVQTMLSNRLQSKPVQLIICAEHWNKHISNLHKRLKRIPMICIGNFMEAALYGNVQFSIDFINSACKEHKLKSLLKDTHKICKSIIVCKEEEIEDIQTSLMLKGIDATVISEDLSKEDILHLEEVWTKTKYGQYTVLVCSDFLLNTMLTVTCASMLIHYSLPSSWTKFVKRFSCLLENVKNPLRMQESKISTQCVVLCDESSLKQMQKFFKYLHCVEFNNQLYNTWKECAKESQYLEEIEKIEKHVVLCQTLKFLGKCCDVHCIRRHTLCKELDISKNLSISGKIKFKIVDIHDVTNYSIHILQHIDDRNNMKIYEYNTNLTRDLSNILRNKSVPVEKVILGQLYAVIVCNDGIDDEYYRCELIDINAENIKVKLIDEGRIIDSFKNNIYELPQEFDEENEPRKLLEVYLADLVPPYEDDNFSAKSFFNIKNMLDRVDCSKIIFSADVHLQLSNTLWIKNVHEDIKISDKVISGFQLTRELLRAKLAVTNHDQLHNLQELCRKADIPLPNCATVSKKQIKMDKVDYQWAYLSMDTVEEVIFCSAVSPDEFYIRLNKFSDLLYTLQKEIQMSLNAVNYPKLKEVHEGTICLAKDEEYERAIVLKVEGEKALLFSVDFGYEVVLPIKDLKFVQQQFITKLPFQSIRCRLHGLQPTFDEWQTDNVDTLYHYAVEPHTDIFRLLYVKVCRRDILCSNQNAYSVLLKDGFGEKKSLVNDLFIISGLATCNGESIEDFLIPEMSLSNDTENGDIDTIIDIFRKTEEVAENTNLDKIANYNYINEDLEFFCDDLEDFFQEFLIASKDKSVTTSKHVFPRLQVVPNVDHYTPEVYWWQNENSVKISIKLSDVANYKLTLTKGRILIFRCVKDNKTYILSLVLYDSVDRMQETSSGLVFKINLTKLNYIEWPRLILSKQRAWNIHYDATTIIVKEETKKLLELPKEFEDDSVSDNDIDIMYHVLSDLDSDFDAEIDHESELL